MYIGKGSYWIYNRVKILVDVNYYLENKEECDI